MGLCDWVKRKTQKDAKKVENLITDHTVCIPCQTYEDMQRQIKELKREASMWQDLYQVTGCDLSDKKTEIEKLKKENRELQDIIDIQKKTIRDLRDGGGTLERIRMAYCVYTEEIGDARSKLSKAFLNK